MAAPGRSFYASLKEYFLDNQFSRNYAGDIQIRTSNPVFISVEVEIL
jgi:hypothetical protein